MQRAILRRLFELLNFSECDDIKNIPPHVITTNVNTIIADNAAMSAVTTTMQANAILN